MDGPGNRGEPVMLVKRQSTMKPMVIRDQHVHPKIARNSAPDWSNCCIIVNIYGVLGFPADFPGLLDDGFRRPQMRREAYFGCNVSGTLVMYQTFTNC